MTDKEMTVKIGRVMESLPDGKKEVLLAYGEGMAAMAQYREDKVLVSNAGPLPATSST